ncbi:hypothetical protein ACFQE1_13825 [Halobium palmae]|uniref:DUF7999 domain-containing protein n=1 Tax=Halobium palmae TaxID=1776492 RepID=A0ABD5S305_9EURY
MSQSGVFGTTEPVVATVTRPMNDHGTLTVEVAAEHSTRHIVEYDTGTVERTLAAMPEGSTLRLVMTPIEGRANVWSVAAPDFRGDAPNRGRPRD